MVDSKTLSRDGAARPKMTVSLISSTAKLISPRSVPFSRVWAEPVWAQDAAEETIGQTVQWDLVNWLITGGRLAVHEASPFDVVKTIVEAVGGVVDTQPDGTVRVRHRFPVPVPDWYKVEPDHILTDTADNLSCHESYVHRTRVNQVLVRGFLPSGAGGHFSAEVDSRPDGLNRGRSAFFAGDTAKIISYVGPGVSTSDPLVTAGKIYREGWVNVWVEEDILFSRTDMAALSKPAVAGIDSVIWLGNDLGSLTVQADKMTIVSERSGFSLARVRYLANTKAWSLTAPDQVAGLQDFPIHVLFQGEHTETPGTGAILCQRGDGAFRGPDISDPLLTSDEAKRSRGRAEIDANEAWQEVSLTCLHRPGLIPGQLVEVHDALMGQSWRGKITSVSHSVDGPKLVTLLEVLRHVQSSV